MADTLNTIFPLFFNYYWGIELLDISIAFTDT